MNRLLKAAAISVMVLIGAQQVMAAPTSFVTPTYITDINAPGFKYTLTSAAASGDTLTLIVKTARFLALERGGALATIPSIAVVTELSAAAAGDSVKVQIDGGNKPTTYMPGWFTMISAANMNFHVGGNTTASSTATPVRAAFIAASTLVPATYWRVRIVTLSTLAAGQTFSMTFPRGNK